MRDLRLPLTPRRSVFASVVEVGVRGLFWCLLLLIVVPLLLEAGGALGQMQPGPPRGQQQRFWNLVLLLRQPQKVLPLLAVWLGAIDLPITYAMSNSMSSRTAWSRLMWLAPTVLGFGLVLGFFYSYVQTIGGMMQGGR